MCIKEKHRCKVSSHAVKAEFVPQIESTSGEYVLIGVSGTSEQLYLSNIVLGIIQGGSEHVFLQLALIR
jgi:hypothetical protein